MDRSEVDASSFHFITWPAIGQGDLSVETTHFTTSALLCELFEPRGVRTPFLSALLVFSHLSGYSIFLLLNRHHLKDTLKYKYVDATFMDHAI